MEIKPDILLSITDSSEVAEARRRAKSLAQQTGFNSVEVEKIAILVTEAGSNILKHAGRGRIILRALQRSGDAAFEMLAMDRGGGIPNLHQAMQDGFSTAGSQGIGMGALKRLSTHFDVYTQPSGTILMSRVWCEGEIPPQRDAFEHGVIAVPHIGEMVNGDNWAAKMLGDRQLVMVVDGLGHGIEAAEASQAAVETFYQTGGTTPAEIMQALDFALLSTRGAAVAIASIDAAHRQIDYAGIGNISTTLVLPGKSQAMVSMNGTVGKQIPRVQTFHYEWEAGGSFPPLLVMHSDGINTRWSLENYPGLVKKNTQLIAGALFRDHTRNSDDATVLVARLAT